MKNTSAKPSASDAAKWKDALAKVHRLNAATADGKDACTTAAALADPDNPPISDDAKFITVDEGRRRPGRPRVPAPKLLISLRLDRDVVEKFRAEGPGWQSRMNEVLKRAAG